MELKDKLTKPFTETEKMAFISQQNLEGNQIKYTDDGLEAWGYSTEEIAEDREKKFRKAFFEIPAIGAAFKGGWYRKKPKGYSSATESINTAFNIVTTMGVLPKDSLVFYTKPDFTKEEQCTEEWLIANQFKNDAMSKEDFVQLYYAFVTAWNTQEHLEEK